MNQKTAIAEQKSMHIKFIFLIILLMGTAIMYLESRMYIDAAYFFAVLIIFFRFIVTKLYQ